MANRSVFILATVMMLLFFLVSNYDRFFFTVHFLESLMYLVILLLLYYGLEEWAYVMSFVTPLVWIVLTLLSGTSLMGLRALAQAVREQRVAFPAEFLSGVILVAGIALMGASGRAFKREVWGRREALRTAVLGTALVGIYYAILIVALLRLSRPQG